jgi:ribosomal-protein-alanine N-acetyltransferase
MIDYSALTYRAEPMHLQDLDAVMEIEYASFSAPWSAKAYDYELQHNANAHYFVIRAQGTGDQPVAPAALSFWQRCFARARMNATPNGRDAVVGYAGFWMMTDEAHVSTIAAHPDWRRRGVGELLLLALIEAASELGARIVTLEVRVSNQLAQDLYRKYGFEIVGERKNYYSDNGEDAFIMTTAPIGTVEFQRRIQDLKMALLARLSR